MRDSIRRRIEDVDRIGGRVFARFWARFCSSPVGYSFSRKRRLSELE